MSLEQGTKLRSEKVIDSPLEDNTSTQSVMTEQNIVDSDSNDDSDISSQLIQMKEIYERKVSELQSEFGQLKDLMMAIISKTNDDSPTSCSQTTSNQPRSRLDIRFSRKHFVPEEFSQMFYIFGITLAKIFLIFPFWISQKRVLNPFDNFCACSL